MPKMLENALDCGITENAFWHMTFGELDRLIESRNRTERKRAKERATYDYILSALIGRAYATTMSKEVTFPEIHEAYPMLFDNVSRETEKQERKDTLSAIRFEAFAHSYNAKYSGGVNKE